MSSKLKALHCWNILLPFWFKGWPWCVYCYLHLEISCFFGLGVSPDSGLPTAYLLMVEKVKVAFFENQIYFLSFSLLRQPAADFNDPKNWRINPFGWFILHEYCFVLKLQSCIPWKNLKYLRHFQELCCSVGLGLAMH